MKNDGSWDFSFWGIILTGVLFLMAYGAGQWTARQAEAGFFGPSDHLEASADGNWGLGFPEKGKNTRWECLCRIFKTVSCLVCRKSG